MNIKQHPWLGGTRSQATKDKISATLKKYKTTDEHRANLSKSRMGYVHLEETKKKIGESQIGKNISDETRKKLSIANKGRKPTPEERAKQYANCPRGETSHFWKGGISGELYPFKFNTTLKNKIRSRDEYKCVQCGIDGTNLHDSKGNAYKLNVHHVNYDKHDCSEQNLVSLCKNCHCKTNTNREAWTEHFQGMM